MAKILLQTGAAATATNCTKIHSLGVNLTYFVSRVPATLTLNKGSHLANTQNRYKEEGEVDIAAGGSGFMIYDC